MSFIYNHLQAQDCMKRDLVLPNNFNYHDDGTDEPFSTDIREAEELAEYVMAALHTQGTTKYYIARFSGLAEVTWMRREGAYVREEKKYVTN